MRSNRYAYRLPSRKTTEAERKPMYCLSCAGDCICDKVFAEELRNNAPVIREIDLGWRWKPWPRFLVIARGRDHNFEVIEKYTDGAEIPVASGLDEQTARRIGWAHRPDSDDLTGVLQASIDELTGADAQNKTQAVQEGWSHSFPPMFEEEYE